VGQGREKQGKLVDAFLMYRQFGELPINKEQGVPALDDPTQKIPTGVWLRGRISAMMTRATSQQREPLEAKIAEEWKVVEAKKDLDAIRTFVSMFDVPFKVGREARLHLAESIMARNDKNAYLEAELNLEQLRVEPYLSAADIGGRALAALARLEEKKSSADSMKLAAAYYRALGQKFPTVKVRDGKTGADLLNELAVKKIFLPYMEDHYSLWNKVKIEARVLDRGDPIFKGYIFDPAGDMTPLTRNHRLVLEPNQIWNNPQIDLLDLSTNTVRWKTNLGPDPTNLNRLFAQMLGNLQNPPQYIAQFWNLVPNPNSHYRLFQVKGHLAVLQICARVYGLDLDNGRVLWSHNLLDRIPSNNIMNNTLYTDSEGNLDIIYHNQFRNEWTTMRLGKLGPVQASYVAVVGHKGLEVLDPLRGTILWSKKDVPTRTHVFGDDQHIFVVSGDRSGNTGAGRVFRAGNGEPVDVPDFGFLYHKDNRIRIIGHNILAAQAGKAGLTFRLYNILTGKDVWSKSFAAGGVRLVTEDPDLTGVIEPSGKMTVLNALTGQQILQTHVLQGRIKAQDMKNLHEPLLLQDSQRYYLALNQALDHNVVAGGVVRSNFNNNLRCAVVNGWFLAFEKADGKAMVDKTQRTWKKGDLAWHIYKPMANQMIVLEQFKSLPILLFTARYNQSNNFVGFQARTHTQSIDKETGRMIYDPGTQTSNGQPSYHRFTIDRKAGTINLIGFGSTLQHYIDDGRKTAMIPAPQGTQTTVPVVGPPAFQPVLPPEGGGFRPPIKKLPLNK
jgi:outer membrane protein assembly factor BamB